MKVLFSTHPPQSLESDALAIVGWDDTGWAAPSWVGDAGRWIQDLRESQAWSGELYDWTVLPRPAGLTAKQLLLVGGGSSTKFSPVEARRLTGVLVRQLRTKGVRHLAVVLPDPAEASILQGAVEGALLGAWEPTKYKTTDKKKHLAVESVTLLSPGLPAEQAAEPIRRGTIIAGAQNHARDLVHEPANRMTPALLVEAAQALAKSAHLNVQVLDREAMAKLGMGALLGVAQGSSNPPYLIQLTYRPKTATSSDHLALIGKGVTFDTGGLSIKPADSMERMKYDMAGAAAALGAMEGIAALQPSLTVSAFVPTVENMINGDAQRPGDIVTSMNGKTIEVLNTDAEGRLILADAITYAQGQGATHLIDAATLTGAIGVALGHYNVGVFTNNDPLLQRFLLASRTAGEKAWPLPMDEEYKEYLKSANADLPNIGGRYAGSITAAWFLREFADPTPWVHLDIAATAWLEEGRPWLSKGPSGVAVRSLIQLALNW